MTLGSHAGPLAQTADPAAASRTTRATAAQQPRQARTGPEQEFEAALLLALWSAPAASLSRTAPALASPASVRPSSMRPSGQHPDGPRPTTARAIETLSQSQADRLRTIGPGVSLAALARAEMGGQLDSAAPDAQTGEPTAAAPPTRSAAPAARQSSRSTADAPQPAAPVSAAASSTPTSHTAAQRAGAATPSLAALDRLATASDKAVGSANARIAATSSPSSAGSAGYSALGARSAQPVARPASAAAQPPAVANPSIRDQANRTPAPAARPAAPPAPADREQFLAQVHRALGMALRSKDGPVTLHLTPNHLGQLRVDVSRSEQGYSARFDAATPEAHKLLESSLADLKAALEARGLQVDRLDVRLADSSGADAERHSQSSDRGLSADADQPRQWGGGAHPDDNHNTSSQGDGDRPRPASPGASDDAQAAERALSAPDGWSLSDTGLSTMEVVA